MLKSNEADDIAVDALAAYARWSSLIILNIQDKLVFIFHEERYQLTAPSQCREEVTIGNLFSCFFKPGPPFPLPIINIEDDFLCECVTKARHGQYSPVFVIIAQAHYSSEDNLISGNHGIQESNVRLTSVWHDQMLGQFGHHLIHWGRDRIGTIFADDIFKHIFLNVNCCPFVLILLKCFPNGPIINMPVLVWMVVWCRTGNKPLSEPMVA